MKIDAVSDIYRTEPVGIREQPDFLNLVLSARTSLPIYDLHEATRRIERRLGREEGEPNGPRRIDIDLLAYGELVLNTPRLQVPHPRMGERSFVLVPLDEIVPRWRHPVTGETPSQSLGSLERKSWTLRLGPIERR